MRVKLFKSKEFNTQISMLAMVWLFNNFLFFKFIFGVSTSCDETLSIISTTA